MKTPISCSKYDKDKSLKEVRLCLNKDKNDKKFARTSIALKIEWGPFPFYICPRLICI